MVFEKIRQIISEQLGLDEEEVLMESSLVEDLKADSLDVVELVMALEEEFETEIPDEDVENLKTIGDAVKYITEQAKI